MTGAEPPRARADQDFEAQPGEAVDRDADRVGTEQLSDACGPSLMGVERVCDALVNGSAGVISTRPVTLRAISTGQSAPAQMATSRSSSAAVMTSSSAEAVMRAAPASSTSSIRVMSRRRASIVTGVPSEALSGGSAAARVSSSSSLGD